VRGTNFSQLLKSNFEYSKTFIRFLSFVLYCHSQFSFYVIPGMPVGAADLTRNPVLKFPSFQRGVSRPELVEGCVTGCFFYPSVKTDGNEK
jgi:hypothetical protein